jgi:hypothetical protein
MKNIFMVIALAAIGLMIVPLTNLYGKYKPEQNPVSIDKTSREIIIKCFRYPPAEGV